MISKDELERRIHIITPLLAAFPNARITSDTFRAYAIGLADVNEPTLQVAVAKCIKSCKFVPTVAEIIEQAQNMTDAAIGERTKDMDEAWQEVQRAVRYTLAFHEPEFSTPQIKQAVDTIGWMSFVQCESDGLNTLRAQFRGIYESICKRKKDERINMDVLKLVGGNMKLIE